MMKKEKPWNHYLVIYGDNTEMFLRAPNDKAAQEDAVKEGILHGNFSGVKSVHNLGKVTVPNGA